MTQAEKLYFRRQYCKGAANRIYLQLFDAIARQTAYDEAALLRRFHPQLHKKNLARQKHYLQEQLTRALITYERLHGPQSDLYDQVQQVRLLRRKGLTEPALDHWQKAVKKARETESFAKLNLLKSEFEKLILFSNTHTRYDELWGLFQNNVMSYAEYADLITLRDMYTELLLLKRRAHYDLDAAMRERLLHLQQRLEQFPESASGSFWYQHYRRMLDATLRYLLHDYKTAFPLLQAQWEEWKKKTAFVTSDAEFYIELLYMINYAGVACQAYDYVLQVFEHPLHQRITDPVNRAHYEAIRFLALHRVYNKTARYDLVEQLLPPVKKQYPRWEPLLNADLNRTLHLSLGIGSFVLEQYSDALYYVKRSITDYKDGAREEHAAVAQLLLLMITYCLNQPRLFDAQYRSTHAYFSRGRRRTRFETVFVQCLHKSFYMTERKSKLAAYREALDVLEKYPGDASQQMNFAIFNYPGWLISRIQQIPYKTYVISTVKSREKTPTAAGMNTLLTG